MATATATKAKPRAARKTYGPTADEKLVASLIELMEAGVNPWRKEWQCAAAGHHRNLLTGYVYRGCNPLLLEMGAAMRASDLPLWLGFAQARQHKWAPKKGSKGCYILRPQANRRELTDAEGKPMKDDNGDAVIAAWISYKPVCLFNAVDLQGADPAAEAALQALISSQLGAVPDRPEPERLAAAEAALGAWPVPVTYGGDRAFYNAGADRIGMPQRKAFESAEAFYATWAHECVHSTGHSSRLARKLGNAFGSDDYAREELVAELGAFLITRRLEIGSRAENHAAYLQSWARVLKAGPKVLYKVLSDATKAAGLIVPEAADTGEDASAVVDA